MISYYDLLTMIKSGNVPKKVIFFGCVYEWTGNSYIYESENDYPHLSDYFLEGKMFDKVIEIIEENKEIEKLEGGNKNGNWDFYKYKRHVIWKFI